MTADRTVTARVLAVLWAFDADHRALRLTDIAQRAQLPLSTAHRLVGELERSGAVRRRARGDYVLGPRLHALLLLAGTSAPDHLTPDAATVHAVAAPFLLDLYAVTRATVHLAVREGDQVLYLDRMVGRASVPVVSRVGGHLPLHCTGVGKVLLAHAPDDVLNRVLGSLERRTAHTIVSPGLLAAQLARVRRDGYATTVEEMALGACSVAVPVHCGAHTVAALGVVVPSLTRSRPQLVAALRVAAVGIARALTTSEPS